MVLLALALLAAPTYGSGSANIADNLPQGTVGFSFGFPLGGPTSTFAIPANAAPDIGVTYFIQPRLAVRLDLGLNVQFSPSASSGAAFDLQLAVRSYRARYGSLWLFLQPSVGFGRRYATFAGPGGGNAGVEYLRLGGAVGAEYFFTNNFSVGGTLGLAFAIDGIGGPAGSSVGTSLSTATSGLFASVYF